MFISSAADAAGSQSSHAARQVNRLRRTKIALAVAGKQVERASVARRDHQIRMATRGKNSCRDEIRRDWYRKHLDVRQERRWKFSPANGLKRNVALRSKGIDVAAMNRDDPAATGRRVACGQIVITIFIEICGRQRQCSGLARHEDFL